MDKTAKSLISWLTIVLSVQSQTNHFDQELDNSVWADQGSALVLRSDQGHQNHMAKNGKGGFPRKIGIVLFKGG
jgi:hypothetical protein